MGGAIGIAPCGAVQCTLVCLDAQLRLDDEELTYSVEEVARRSDSLEEESPHYTATEDSARDTKHSLHLRNVVAAVATPNQALEEVFD